MEKISTFYRAKLGFDPYDYQIKIFELLLSGKNVIISVPTGAGKTWASIMPFLYTKERKLENFPLKMIYSLPQRTLTNSIFEDVKKIVPDNISIQTGEYSEDPFFENDIIFSTIDQTLSNFLCFPLPLSPRQANINAGALIGSYLVFDEFHLLDPKLSMSTSLGIIRLLKNLCRICIMTATLTDDYIQFLKKDLGLEFEVVSINDFPQDVKRINSLKPAKGKDFKKSVTIIPDKKLNAVDIIEKHTNKTIIICNRVETAQNLYHDLYRIKSEETELFCIHSRYFDRDRKLGELKIKEYFGKGNTKYNSIIVATQVIEAGMDISCDKMHTEISPINSFLQRAGRCARFADEYGDIFVYDVLDLEEREKIKIEPENEEDKEEVRKINNRYLPYNKELCEKSFVEVNKCGSIDENISIKLVNTVLKDDESQKVSIITANSFNAEKIRNSWVDCNKNHYRETIRDIQSIEIVLIDMEQFKNKKIIPWKYETINVYKWSFIGWVKRIEQNRIHDDWICAKAIHGEDSVFDFEWQDKDAYFLRELHFNDLKNHSEVVFVNNRYFDYTPAGLMVFNNEKNATSPIKDISIKEKQAYIFQKDTFYQHNKALLNCFTKKYSSDLGFVYNELDKYWGRKYDWEKLITYAICFHDYGKLNNDWQKPMKEFQYRKTGIANPNEMLAHTDYDENTDLELAKECRIKNKPSHAGIGAVQVYNILVDCYSENIARAVSSAVLKHHSPETKSFDNFCVSNIGLNEMKHLQNEYGITGELLKKERGGSLEEIIPGNEKERLLYLFIVRILRLCDQKATESKDDYYIE